VCCFGCSGCRRDAEWRHALPGLIACRVACLQWSEWHTHTFQGLSEHWAGVGRLQHVAMAVLAAVPAACLAMRSSDCYVNDACSRHDHHRFQTIAVSQDNVRSACTAPVWSSSGNCADSCGCVYRSRVVMHFRNDILVVMVRDGWLKCCGSSIKP
jgi:hypothetical protein